MHRASVVFFFAFFLLSLKAAAQLRLLQPPDSVQHPISLRPLPQNFYKQTLGYFCRQELRLQKLTSLPLYFRVGSKDYVDWLERKPNAGKSVMSNQ